MSTKSKQEDKTIEWLGGIYTEVEELQSVLSDDIDFEHFAATNGEIVMKDKTKAPPKPPARATVEVLAWMSKERGVIVGKQSFDMNQAAQHAVAHFWQSTKEPMEGEAHSPTRLIIGDPALAILMRKALAPGILVINEYSPKLDMLMESQFDLHPADIDTSVPEIAALLPP